MSAPPKKRILVMMSAYNGERYLREQIDSIIGQNTEHEITLRIRDDGSRDGTREIVKEYASRYPGQIELQAGDNIGYNASFFTLVQNAEGYDYYSISDQDDVWLPDKLQTACDAIDKAGENMPVLYASTSYLVHDDLVPYGTTRKKEREMTIYNTIIQNICPGHTQVMNNSLLGLLKGEINAKRIYVYDAWIQNIANLYGQIVFDNEPHTYYRQHEGNQLGYGFGKLGQLLVSLQREKTGDGLKYRGQIEYFVEANRKELERNGYIIELDKFVSSRRTAQRLWYAVTGKLYRQNAIETMLFRLAVAAGRY